MQAASSRSHIASGPAWGGPAPAHTNRNRRGAIWRPFCFSYRPLERNAQCNRRKGQRPNGAGDTPNEHDILTGSTTDGRAFPEGADKTCRNYTSGADNGSVQLGHYDRTGGGVGNSSWNSAHASRGCSQPKLVSTGGAGLLYCFAAS